MITYSLPQTENMKTMVLEQLQKRQAPMSLQELEIKLEREKNLSSRYVKEVAWELVEEGKIQFNSTWDLEIC